MALKKAIVTGHKGFVGSYLFDLLKKDRSIKELYGIDLVEGHDLLNPTVVERAIDSVKPDYVWHLAAHAFVPTSFADPVKVFENNTKSTHNILEAIRKFSPSTKLMIAGSSEEYGDVQPSECPINEANYLRPQSTYAVSKVACEYLGRQYADTWGLNVVVTRAFNHTGPGRPDYYAESSFAKQVAQLEKKQIPAVRVGNLDAVRDYTDVRDMVQAYRLAIDLPSDVYVIGSGQTYSMREILIKLFNLAGIPFDFEIDPSRMRPSDVPLLEADPSMFVRFTGWSPKIGIDKTLRDILDYWRKRV